NQLEDTHFLETINIAVVGHKTENALKKYGVTADFTPTVYNVVAMSEEFLKKHPFANHILLIRGNLSRNVLPNYFTEKQLDFENLVVYETVANKQIKSTLNNIFETETVDDITFMSPSTKKRSLELLAKNYHAETLEIQLIIIAMTTEQLEFKHAFYELSI